MAAAGESGVKAALKRFAPARAAWRRWLLLKAELVTYAWALNDAWRYNRTNHYRRALASREAMKAEITKAYHSLEKGLSLAEPRPGFGKPVALRLADQVASYVDAFGVDPFLLAPVDALHSYHRFQTGQGVALPLVEARLAVLEAAVTPLRGPDARHGGTEIYTYDDIQRLGRLEGFEGFLRARHSVRNFAPRPVDPATMARAVELAQLAPSACNRQGARAYVVTEPARVKEVLALQPGNRGFGDRAGAAVVIAGRNNAFSGPEERNQALIDGALFAMTFVYALHSLGLGSCMLAWCVSPQRDRQLADMIGLKDEDRVVMLIAVGHLPETLAVPVSARLERDDVMVQVG